MQFRGASSTCVPKDLWKNIAQALNLDKDLPQAEEDGVLIYRHKKLIVYVNKSIERGTEGEDIVLGSYSCGVISVYPCPKCTIGFLTLTYLHEICHAWLSQYHEELDDMYDTCAFCEEFAHRSYEILGGRNVGRYCWDYDLSIQGAVEKLPDFQKYAHSLITMAPETLSEIIKRYNNKISS